MAPVPSTADCAPGRVVASAAFLFVMPFVVAMGTACSGASDPLALMSLSASSESGAGADASVAADAGPSSAALPSLHAGTGTGDALSQATEEGGTVDAAGRVDAGADSTSPAEAGSTPLADATSPPASCAVSFTVADAFVDGLVDTTVALGGSGDALGNWDPEAAPAMTSIGTGAWTLTLVLNDGDTLQFRFVKRGTNSFVWEDWSDGSNRSLSVDCSPGAAPSMDGGPVVGTAYTGDFDVQPPDAP